MRAVIDTNVLISATFWPGKPKQLLNQVRRGRIDFLTSEILLVELKVVLTRDDKPFKLSEEEAQHVLARSWTSPRSLNHIALSHDVETKQTTECWNVPSMAKPIGS